MPALTPENHDEFIRRFASCYDGVIKNISVVCSSLDGGTGAINKGWIEVTLEAQDMDAPPDGSGWATLKLRFDGIDAYRFEGPPLGIIFDAIHFLWIDRLVFVDLGDLEDDGDFSTIEAMRKSRIYVAAEKVTYEVL